MANRWVCRAPPPLSEQQKQAIIQSLDTYCIQESWDTIQSLLSPRSRKYFHYDLCTAVIYKSLITLTLDNPFWFLDGKRNPTDETGDPTFPERLQYLYQRYHEGKCTVFYSCPPPLQHEYSHAIPLPFGRWMTDRLVFSSSSKPSQCHLVATGHLRPCQLG